MAAYRRMRLNVDAVVNILLKTLISHANPCECRIFSPVDNGFLRPSQSRSDEKLHFIITMQCSRSVLMMCEYESYHYGD